jgi:hypothetical protein
MLLVAAAGVFLGPIVARMDIDCAVNRVLDDDSGDLEEDSAVSSWLLRVLLFIFVLIVLSLVVIIVLELVAIVPPVSGAAFLNDAFELHDLDLADVVSLSDAPLLLRLVHLPHLALLIHVERLGIVGLHIH